MPKKRSDLYLEYLKSETWRKKRQEVIELYQTCVLCNGNGIFHVHHRKYTNLGKENIHTDVTLLCEKCHNNYHRLFREPKKKKKKKKKSLPPVGPRVRSRLWWKEQEQRYKEIHKKPKKSTPPKTKSQKELHGRVNQIRQAKKSRGL